MKNRVLSAILAFGIILSNCSGGFTAIAENGDNTILPTENLAAGGGQSGNKGEDTPGILDENHEDDNKNNSGVVVLKAKEYNTVSFYKGQDPVALLNQKGDGNKPKYTEYFRFESNDFSVLPDSIYDMFRVERDPDDDATSSSTVKLRFVPVMQDIPYTLDHSFSVNLKDYNVSVAVKRIAGNDKKVYLSVGDEYLISNSDDESSFKSSTIALSALNNGKYYIRNNKSGSKEYNAISGEKTYVNNPEADLANYILVSDYDLSTTRATSDPVTVTFTAYAWSDSLKFTLRSDLKTYRSSVEYSPTRPDAEGNGFVYEIKYQIVPSDEDPVIILKNLHASVAADNSVDNETNFRVKDNTPRQNLNDEFVIDTVLPNIEKNGEWIDEHQNDVYQFNATDEDSRIVSIEYSFDKENWKTPDEIYNPMSKQVDFRVRVPRYEPDKKALYVKVVDEAGNVEIGTITEDKLWIAKSSVSESETQEISDAIEGVELYYSKDGTFNAASLEKITDTTIFHNDSFGNSINKPLQIRIKSNEKNRIFIDNDELLRYEKETTNDDGKIEKEFEYFYYNFNTNYNYDVNITINKRSVKLPLRSKIITDYLGFEMESSHIIVEAQKPTADLDNPEFASENVSKVDKWYGIKEKDGIFQINVNDEEPGSGIRSITIKDNGSFITANAAHPVTFTPSKGDARKITALVSKQNFNNSSEKISDVSVAIPLEIFEDGDHVLEITVVDNAGNTQMGFASISNVNEDSTDGSLKFSTDFTRPKGKVLLATNSREINKEDWFDTVTPIDFDLVMDDGGENGNPYKVKWKTNSGVKWKQDVRFPFNTGGTSRLDTVTVTMTVDEPYDENHSNTISAVFYDEAGNFSEDGDVNPITIYKDTSDPTIDSVNIYHEPETGVKKIIRILSFGLFFNNDVTITVEASDVEHDSKLANDALEVSLDGGYTYITMNAENNDPADKGKYYYTIPISDTVQSGVLVFRVTDQFGHCSNTVEYIETNDGNKKKGIETDNNGKKYIFENIPPEVNITLPESDGAERSDNTVWYKLDKDITITVQDHDSGINSVEVQVNEISIKNNEISEDNDVAFQKGIDTSLHEYHLSTDEIIEFIRSSHNEPADGHYVVKVEVEDNAGNKNTDQKDYYIDKESPKVEKIEFSVSSADGYNDGEVFQFVEQLEYGFYFKTDLVATINISDKSPSSELREIEYVLVDYNNGEKGEEHPGKIDIESQVHPADGTVDSVGTASFTIPRDFKGQILVKAFDYVGNESVEVTPDLFVVDTTEKHESEEHIEIIGFGASEHTDDKGNPLFDEDVNLKVRISDTMSGIRDISYSISSEQDTQESKTITIGNSGYTIGQEIGDGWTITAMDENLVTEVTRDYPFSVDNNYIQLDFAMTDRANNVSEKTSEIFSIDKTAPVINVVFNSSAGNGSYYREHRIATITVIERNFDASRITASITNAIGSVPGLSFTSNSDTEHVAVLDFSEGDYTFGIEGTDRSDHTAVINYSGGNERSFYVDLTNPTVIDNFEQFINELQNSFNGSKEMTFTVREHNFVPELMNVRVYRTKAGQELTTASREDCTSEYLAANKWNSNGDIHTISFMFDADYVYQVAISGADASGRLLADKVSPVFEIDTTPPVLKTPNNLEKLVYTSKNTETEAEAVVFEDSNIARIEYSIVSYQMKLNEDNVGYDMKVDSETFEVKDDSVVINNEYFNQDGIYEVRCVAYDVAGNSSKESTHTFVIQRDTDFLVYIPNSNKESQSGLYKFNERGIRSADFEDIEIVTYLTKDKSFEVQVDGTEVTDTDLEIKKDDRKINQVNKYDVTLKNSYISQNFSDDTIDTDLTLNAVATDGENEQIITLGHIYIDNVKPVGEYEEALQDLGTFDGFYGMENRTVMIEGVSPDIDVDRCEIQLNDTILKNADGGFIYDEKAHTISFTINKGYTDIRPTLVDKAGNINNLAMVKNVYVGGVFARWWYLFVSGILIVLAIPVFIIIALSKKKKGKSW